MRAGPKPKGAGSRFEIGDDGSIKERENATPQKKGCSREKREHNLTNLTQRRREAASGGGGRRRRQRPAATKWS